jgi:predicted DNA binding CopG/RHH family protein
MKKRMGRPPKPKAQKKSKLVQLRVSSAEDRRLKEKADAAGLSVSEFLRLQARD